MAPNACLYAASSRACAEAEASRPLGVHKMYVLKPRRKLFLWDLAKVIEFIGYPELLDNVRRAPTDAIWGYQKVPTISQILAERLRHLGGHGIAFASTRHPQGLNIVVFVDSTIHAGELFEARRLP